MRIWFLVVIVSLACAGPLVAQDGELNFNTGLSHLRDGRLALAISSFKQAIEEDDENPYFYKGLGLAYMQAQELDSAVKAFRKALELNPYYVDVYNDLGTALIVKGEREQGKRQYLTAFNHPQNPSPELAARNLGQALLEERKPEEALSWFSSSLQRNQRYPDAYIGIGDCLRALGRAEEAVTRLERGHAELPDELALTLALAEQYYAVGRFGDARRLFEGVASRDPGGALGRRALDRLRAFPQ